MEAAQLADFILKTGRAPRNSLLIFEIRLPTPKQKKELRVTWSKIQTRLQCHRQQEKRANSYLIAPRSGPILTFSPLCLFARPPLSRQLPLMARSMWDGNSSRLWGRDLSIQTGGRGDDYRKSRSGLHRGTFWAPSLPTSWVTLFSGGGFATPYIREVV